MTTDPLRDSIAHVVVQTILGQPYGLASIDELAYVTNASHHEVRDAVSHLIDADIIAEYEMTESHEDYPTTFYGISSAGIDELAVRNFLKGVPMARAVYRATSLPDAIERHQDAPRPRLPDDVQTALRLKDDD